MLTIVQSSDIALNTLMLMLEDKPTRFVLDCKDMSPMFEGRVLHFTATSPQFPDFSFNFTMDMEHMGDMSLLFTHLLKLAQGVENVASNNQDSDRDR